ncbi:MAG: hypothetical protein EVA87_07445 [Rhodospirillaceae bacterium]|nr:MAG: hypothetical protein EVA87_07445 [Rhodospirillaceae bacterium]
MLFSPNVSGTQAAVIAQTINVDFSGFLDVNSVPPPYDPGTGQVVLTYDDAPPVSIMGQAVDSTFFWVPMGVIDTGDVFFDLQIGVIVTLGDEWNPVGITSASGQFIYVDGVIIGPFPAGKNASSGGLTRTTQSAPKTISSLASLVLFGFGIQAIGLKRRRV